MLHAASHSASLEAERDLAGIKAELADLKQQVSQHLLNGLEERLVLIRTDLTAELASAARQEREHHAEMSRRLSALEPWSAESAALHADLRQLKAIKTRIGCVASSPYRTNS